MALTSVIDASNKVPGTFLQVSLGVGPTSALGSPRRVLLYGNKTTAGTAAAATPVFIASIDDARTLFGAGSELFLMARAAFRQNPSAQLWGVVVAESAGAAAVSNIVASGTITAPGTIEITIGEEVVTAAFASGDNATTVGAAIAAAINARTDAPATAVNTTGTVAVTAKCKGPRGNDIVCRARVIEAGTGAAVTSPGVLGVTTPGATSDDPQNALDAAAAQRWHYHVAAHSDATQLAKYKTLVNANAGPTIGFREQVIAGSRDTLANAITLATGLNAARMQLAWHYNGDHTPAQVAAAVAAARQEAESADPAANLDGIVFPSIKPQTALADAPVASELASALNNGITPLRVSGSTVSLTRSVTTRSRDAASNASFTVLDTSKVTVPDFVADDIALNFPVEFAGFKLTTAVVEEPPAGVASAAVVRDWILSRLLASEAAGYIENVASNAGNLVVEVAASPDGRVNATIPVDVIEGLHQFAGDVRQVG